MNRRHTSLAAILTMSLAVLHLALIASSKDRFVAWADAQVSINEIRINQPGTDSDEYIELAGPASTSLEGLTYLVVGDGAPTASSGVIEAVIDLSGNSVPADGLFLAAEDNDTFGVAADLITALDFENSDNVSHLLVTGFTGSRDDDLDTDDDGVLDVTPWTAIVDLIALIEEENPPSNTEYHYGPPTIGPDGYFVPGHAYRCPDSRGGWVIGAFDPVGGDDTPGTANECPVPDLGVDKEGPQCVLIGETISYTITLANAGSTSATNIILTDALPISTTYASDDSGWTCPSCVPGATGPITWIVGEVLSNTVSSFNLTVHADSGVTGGTVLVNEVEISTDTDGDDPANNTARWETTVSAVLRIHEIQAGHHYSPYEGQVVCDVPGIVTVVTSDGFYMQDPYPDGDHATSEGIFVYTYAPPEVGDWVVVSGEVDEYYPGGYDAGNLSTTELKDVTISISSTGNALPAPIVIGTGGRVPPAQIIDDDASGDVNTTGTFDPGTDGVDFYESLESMLVQVNEALVVGPTSKYGGIAVVSDNGVNAGLLTPRGGIVIQADDFNPERIIIGDALVNGPPQVAMGASFNDPITGILAYSYGNFKLWNPVALPGTTGGVISDTTSLSGTANQLTAATLSVENLDPGDTKFGALAHEIVTHLQSPDIIALQEIQDNSGPTDNGVVDASLTYSTLITAIQDAGGPIYDYRDIAPLDGQDGGEPGGNIRVGFLFRPDRVTFVDRGTGTATDAVTVAMGPSGVELSLSPGRIDPTSVAFEGSRKPLAGEFLFDGRKVFVVANHFNSKYGDDPLFGRVQPPVVNSAVSRALKAQVVNDFVDSILALDPHANVIVLGDLNDFQFSEPISDVLAADILTNLIDTLHISEQYTYIYEGNSEVLDHILVTRNLAVAAPEVDIVHMNAEFPVSARPTDHDPVVARLLVPEPRVYLPLVFRNH